MADGLLEAVRGLHLAHPELGPKPLLAKLRQQQPDLAAGNKEVREALAALKAEESKPTEPARSRRRAARHRRIVPKKANSAKICTGNLTGSGLRKYALRQNHTIPV